MSANEPPRPPSPTPSTGKKSFPGLSPSQISIPELDRKEAARKKAEIEARQKADPQAPDASGLNSSGLPSSQAYYSGAKEAPLHTSVVTPILESRFWIKVIAVGALLIGFFWVKDSITLFMYPGIGAKLRGFIGITLCFFFFVKPAHKLWLICGELDQLEHERDQSTLAMVLYAHSQLWKYGGMAVAGGVLYSLASWLAGPLSKMLSLN